MYSDLNVISPLISILAIKAPLPATWVARELASKSANCCFRAVVIRISLSVKVCRNTVDEGQQQPFDEAPDNDVTEESAGFRRPEVVIVVKTEPWKRDTIIQSAEIFFLVVSIKCLFPLVLLALSLLRVLLVLQTQL
jgi:hypothetical protein